MKEAEALKIPLGDRVRDRITGFQGIAIAITDWLIGCLRISIQPEELKDGKPVEGHSFDEPQLEIVEAGAYYKNLPEVQQPSKAKKDEPGGPRPEPVPRTDAKR